MDALRNLIIASDIKSSLYVRKIAVVMKSTASTCMALHNTRCKGINPVPKRALRSGWSVMQSAIVT